MDLSAQEGALHAALSSLQLIHIALAHDSPALLSAFRHSPGSCASCPPPLLPWHPAATQPRDTHQSLLSPHLVTATKPQLSPPMALLHPQPGYSICHNPVLLCLTQGRQQTVEFDRSGWKINSPGFAPRLRNSRDTLRAGCLEQTPSSLLKKSWCRCPRCPHTAAGASP